MGEQAAKPELTTEERQALAVDLRRRGHSYGQIGAALGVGATRAAKIVKQALDRVNKHLAEDTAQLRRLELIKLDELERRLWSQVGDVLPPRICDALVRIAQRRARLAGLDTQTTKFDPAYPPPWLDPKAQQDSVEQDDPADEAEPPQESQP